MSEEKVLSVNNLVINFKTDNGTVHAVRDVSFDLYRGETLCIVGESGSGKSVTSKAIMGILANNAIIEQGNIIYRGENLLEVSEEEFHKIRGHKIGMIFQDPLSSLNPIVRIGKQITEATLINSDKLKLMYNDIISDDLIAYKNTIAKRDIQIDNEKKKLAQFIIEINKQEAEKVDSIEKAKAEEKIALEEQIKQLQVELYKNIEELKAQFGKVNDDAKRQQLQKSISELETKTIGEINSLKEEIKKQNAEFDAKIKEAKANVSANKTNIKKQIAEKKASVATTIANIKKEANEKAIPLKAKLKEKQAFAKAQVKEYKNKVLSEYKAQLDVLKAKLAAAKNDEEKASVKKEIEAVKLECVNKLKITKAEAKRRALEIMREVGIPEPERRFRQYPFEFSGGMRQRIVIAIALTETPEILICDEPTTALDVTIQAQILELINRIKEERKLSCIFITHDLGVVANMADRVAVMYAGKIVEHGKAEEIFFDPRHPYTWALLSSIPDVDSKEKLEAIPGTPPNMIYPPKGDAFAIRSKYAMAIDFKEEPPYFKVSDTHYAATWLLDERAPKVEMPKIVSERIKNALKEEM